MAREGFTRSGQGRQGPPATARLIATFEAHQMKRLLLLLGVVGCSAVDSREPSTWAVDTLSNGAIHVANSGVGLWDQESAWRLTPDIVLGEIEGEGAAVFGSIRALQADDDGRIYVADGQANEVRIFAADGTHLRTVGRTGEGPGEFTALLGSARGSCREAIPGRTN